MAGCPLLEGNKILYIFDRKHHQYCFNHQWSNTNRFVGGLADRNSWESTGSPSACLWKTLWCSHWSQNRRSSPQSSSPAEPAVFLRKSTHKAHSTRLKRCDLLVDKALKLMINQFYICINIFLVKWFVKESSTYNNVQIQYRHDASAGRYTGSYRIPVFIFLTILIFLIPQYRCHINNVRNVTLLERGLFSLLYFGEDTAVCVTKRESSEIEALVECDEREEVIHIIHIDRHKYPPSAA